MKRSSWIVIVVLGAVMLSATVGWATTVYWRGGRYTLPGTYQSRVLDAILTDHKRDIDALLAANTALAARVAALESRMAAAEGNIATNTQDIATNAADIATNTADIGTNAAGIAANAANIGTNTANIAGLTSSLNSHVANTTSAHSYDARFTRHSESTLRILRGRAYADGSIASGLGFTISHTAGTGVYTITYSPTFSGWGVPVISPLEESLVFWNTIGSGGCTFTLRDTSGTDVEADFSFIIAGN